MSRAVVQIKADAERNLIATWARTSRSDHG
jgi:hypothetical protein